jgi:expansin
LDLFPTAFSTLANPTVGVIDVTWSYIDCPITSPLQLHNKEGVSAYWFSMQVVNANKRVVSLEVSTDGGSTWQSTTRQSYNFFENSSGFGTSSVDVRVTSIDGDVVIVNNVDVTPDLVVTASANFGGASAAAAVASTSPAAVQSPTSTEAPVSIPTTTAGADFVQVATQTTSYAAAVAAIASSSTITPAPTPTPSSEPEITYVTIEACPA